MDTPAKKPVKRSTYSGQNTNPTIETEPKGATQMNAIPDKTKTKMKRPSKGVAKHNRKVKQEARRISIPGAEVVKRKRRTA
jgi:hypothetical protein